MRTAFLIFAVSVGLMAAAVTTAQNPAPTLSQSEINALQREITSHERSLKKFSSLVRKLESTERESSNTGRRRALNDLQNAMGDVIIVAERKLEHGAEVEQVSTSDTGSGGGVRTRRRVYQVPESENSPPVAYYHLVRQQAIFVSCKTSLEPAAAKQGSSYAQYLGLVKEFAGLMSRGIDALRAQLPPEPAAEEPLTANG